MRVLVTGAGRGGTCLAREVVRGLNIVKVTQLEEDGNFFKYETLPENYGTKLATEHPSFTTENIIKVMKTHDDLYIVFALRNPIDNCLSKIARGHRHSDDGTVKTAIAAVKHSRNIYDELRRLFPTRVCSVRMEHLILYPLTEVARIALALGAKLSEMSNDVWQFYKHNTNESQKERYGNVLDRSQVDIYKRWDTAYDGFFKDKKKDVAKIQEAFD